MSAGNNYLSAILAICGGYQSSALICFLTIYGGAVVLLIMLFIYLYKRVNLNNHYNYECVKKLTKDNDNFNEYCTGTSAILRHLYKPQYCKSILDKTCSRILPNVSGITKLLLIIITIILIILIFFVILPYLLFRYVFKSK